MNLFESKELAYKLGMLVWEGDHFATVHHSNERDQERGEEGDRPQAGSAVDDRVMLTTAGREYCRRSNDAHGRTPGVL